MNSDIRISVNLVTNHKIKRLMMKHGPEAFYSLICLWTYAAQRSYNGRLTNMDDVDISLASNWKGENYGEFIETLVELRLLDKVGEEYAIHDWLENNPYAAGAGKRSDKARFSRLARENNVAFKALKEQGISSISSADYSEILNGSFTEVYERITTVERPSCTRFTPSPIPSPIPSPTPYVEKHSAPKKTGAAKTEEEIFYQTKKKKKLRGESLERFLVFWKEFSYPKGKAEAADAWLDVYVPENFDAIIKGAKTECRNRPEIIAKGSTPKMGQGWLTGRRWEDEYVSGKFSKNDCAKCELKTRGLCADQKNNCEKFREKAK